jgi:hypothetical protein
MVQEIDNNRNKRGKDVATLSRERGIVIVVLLPLANIVVRHGAA